MKKRILIKIISFALILITLSGGVIASALTVSAASTESGEKQYSNVLDDLQKDSRFDAATYPDKTDDPSVQLIQIAESEDGQLFLYVYQPANSKIDLQCKAVSISVGFSSNGQGLDPKLYDLILVSTEGVFDKYVVNGFALPDAAERYYNIVQILREFNSAVDPEGDKTTYKEIVCKSYAVGQQWCAYKVNNALVYEMNTFNTAKLEIEASATIFVEGGVRFGNIFGLNFDVESHFVIFKPTDYDVRYIYDATVFCKYRAYEQNGYLWGLWEGDRVYPNGDTYSEQYIKLSDKEEPVLVDGQGLWSNEYSFDRIMTLSEFKTNLDNQGISYDKEEVSRLSDDYWVFSYYETPLITDTGTAGGVTGAFQKYIGVEVEGYVLQIHFMDTSGNVYDLGVVSDGFRSSGSLGEAGGVDFKKMFDDIEKIIAIITLILVGIPVVIFFIFFAPVIKSFFKAVGLGILWFFELVFLILTFPFRLIWYLLFRKK